MSDKNINIITNTVLSVLTLISIIFSVLKLCGIITWSWFWIWSFILIPALVFTAMICFIMIFGGLVFMIDLIRRGGLW